MFGGSVVSSQGSRQLLDLIEIVNDGVRECLWKGVEIMYIEKKGDNE